jgi:small subunit ribosomal protein S4
MIIKAKYKICRRLGAGIFEKCQTQKFVISESKKARIVKKRRTNRSDYGRDLIEKQKARLMYGISEKQFSKYVKEAFAQKSDLTPADNLYQKLEIRLDNAVYQLGFVPTRSFSRQVVSHGHIRVNGKKVTIPSFRVKKGDIISIKPSSLKKPLFADLEERLKNYNPPAWLKYDHEKKEAVVQAMPTLSTDLVFDMTSVLQYYSR